MVRTGLMLTFCCYVSCSAQSPGGRILEDEGNYKIVLHHVSCDPRGADPHLCRINYSYRFQNRHSVHIADLGEVPASGEFDYISRKDRITFLETSDPASVITFIDGRKTASTRSDPIPDLPSYDRFPERQIVNGRTAQSDMFLASAQHALKETFNSRYDPDTMRGKIRYLISDYTDIKAPHPNRQLQVAVMLSNPEPVEDSAAFRIRWIAREKNRLEDEWHTPKPASDAALLVESFVNSLCKSIEGRK